MNRANPQQVLERLIASPNDVTAAIAQCFKALVDVAGSPPGSPILVTVTDYTKSPFSTRSRVFGRKALTDHVGMFAWMKFRAAFSISHNARLKLEATMFEANGEIGTTSDESDLDSWPELIHYIHKLNVSVHSAN
ncbi:hypothetical protein PILCRDRAFT_827086 [Piloderma croceum F 1598]|uniref:Uncharacterized protein n=1 Tax=Piloderma croceum (strain F 1598) TaxID=765440 RepID=A0A0C3F6V9_PILCF|nr:hypothetical protein PILCRDRAFT_827086 [Piloderma croceum F 1598]